MEARLDHFEAATRRNVRHLAYWTGGWALTVALASFGPKHLWDSDPTISTFAIFINAIVGVGMILMNRKYTNGLDEMQRKVVMEAKALALGVGVVGGICYTMLDATNIISFDAEIGHVIILIGITYIVATIVGTLRYK
jgi:hypothetical protein